VALTTMNDDTTAPRLALTVGPLLYYWPRETLLHFYAEVAESAADSVVLGEVVCARRRAAHARAAPRGWRH
jgi:hypothetical protein